MILIAEFGNYVSVACRIRSIVEKEHLLEHSTDIFDSRYIGIEKFPYHDTFAVSVSGNS